MAEKTFALMIEEVARRFGEYRKGTVSSDSTTDTLIDEDNLYEPDDYWVGHYLHMLSGDNSGVERPIDDYDQGDTKMTVSPAFASSIASNDTYEILPVRREQIKDAINAAIEEMGLSWPVIKSDTSTITSFSGADFDYSIATDTVQLLGVYTRHSATDGWRPVPTEHWQVVGKMGSQTLMLAPTYHIPDSAAVRLDYLAYPSTLSSDSDTLDIGEPGERDAVRFVIGHALFWLHDQAASAAPTGAGFRPHLTQAQYYQETAEKLRARAAQWPPRQQEEEGD
jgi:hypothetical protein